MKIQSIAMLAVLFFFPVVLLSTNYASHFYGGVIQKKEWTLARNQKGIKVFVKSQENTKLKAFKAITTIDSPAKAIVAKLMDFDNYPNWMEKCHTSKTLKKVSPTEYYYYHLTKAPWPAQNRDNIVHLNIKEDYQTGIITFDLQNAPDFIAEKSGIIRIHNFEASWILTPQGDQKTKIEYKAFADPSGDLHTWLINTNLVNIPYLSLINLKNSL